MTEGSTAGPCASRYGCSIILALHNEAFYTGTRASDVLPAYTSFPVLAETFPS